MGPQYKYTLSLQEKEREVQRAASSVHLETIATDTWIQ